MLSIVESEIVGRGVAVTSVTGIVLLQLAVHLLLRRSIPTLARQCRDHAFGSHSFVRARRGSCS